MRYAVTYLSDFKYFDKVDEVFFDSPREDLYEMVSGVLVNSNQTANILLTDFMRENIDNYIGIFEKIKQEFNIIISINYLFDRELIPVLKEKNIDFMFNDRANDLATLAVMKKLGAREAIIGGDLCFCLDKINKIRDNSFRIRVYPDVAYDTFTYEDAYRTLVSFWIRPEDTEVYEKYIDTFEIFHLENLSVIFKIYKQQQWLGNLREIILHLKEDIENTSLPPFFGQFRTTCGRECLYEKCNICERTLDVSKKFTEANISIIKPKER
jgi:hypothetical protein